MKTVKELKEEIQANNIDHENELARIGKRLAVEEMLETGFCIVNNVPSTNKRYFPALIKKIKNGEIKDLTFIPKKTWFGSDLIIETKEL